MFDVDTEEFDYVSHAGTQLRARLYRPRGQGPFPAMVDLHGGAWIQGSFANNDPINRPIAAGGVVVLAVDYRLPPAGTYPSSVADVNYAIRWLKMNAERCGTRPELVGVMGTSAGGHLAVLAALKPQDARYAEVPLKGGAAFDARVECVVTMWPVICPLTRFRENLERNARGDQLHADRIGSGLDQMKYWLTEDAMADGSPMLALGRGDRVELPDTLYVQASGDQLHPRHCMDRFCAAYQKAGGWLETVLVEGEPYDLVRSDAGSSEAKRAVKRIIEFIHECKGRAVR
ncbi:MAG TPA: alpha/beta hydrolase [Alphaproteobacteria bacterium]